MATSIDKGSQVRTIVYGQALSSQRENQGFHELVPTGIYKGLNLTLISPTEVQVSEGICFIADDRNVSKTSIKIETTIPYSLVDEVVEIRPYIILRYNWAPTRNNYMDILAVSGAELETDDLIVGVGTFDGGGVLTGFDLTLRNISFLSTMSMDGNTLTITADVHVAGTLTSDS